MWDWQLKVVYFILRTRILQSRVNDHVGYKRIISMFLCTNPSREAIDLIEVRLINVVSVKNMMWSLGEKPAWVTKLVPSFKLWGYLRSA